MNAFTRLADLLSVDTTFLPEGRRTATVNTIRQEAAHVSDWVTLEDVKAAFLKLSVPRDGDDGPTTGRRATLRYLAEVTLSSEPDTGKSTNLINAFRLLNAYFNNSTDPRLASIANRAGRECLELGGVLGRIEL